MLEEIAAAREREGQPRADRPAAVDDALEENGERVGFQAGEPLADRPYSQYATGEDILRPEASDVLEAVARHELVGDVDDVADELNATESTVRKAFELHGVDTPTDGGSVDTVAEDEIELPLHGTVNVDHLRTPIHEDARLLEHLYVECGLGVAELREFLETQMNHGRDPEQSRWGVREADTRGALEDVGLLEDGDNGKVDPKRAKDIRLGGATVSNLDESDRGTSGGLNVDTSDF